MSAPQRVQRTITTAASAPDVFVYLSDFRHTEEWDPGTIRTTLVDGDGGVGSVYANESRFAGRTVRLRYVVTELVTDEVVELRGEGPSIVTEDRMTIRALPDGGSMVTYRAEFRFSGLAGIVSPLLRPLLARIGNETGARLTKALSRI